MRTTYLDLLRVYRDPDKKPVSAGSGILLDVPILSCLHWQARNDHATYVIYQYHNI